MLLTVAKDRIGAEIVKRVGQGRRHGVDWGGHVHPTFARGRS